MLVFSEADRSMGLVVDEIVDIVEDRLNIEVASEQPGVLGSAVIKGQATEVIDIGHYLPMAFEDWLSPQVDPRRRRRRRKLLFVDDSPFFRNMLTPVLRAAGYEVMACTDGEAALRGAEGRTSASTSSSPTSRCRAWTASSSPSRSRPIRAPGTCR